MPKVSEKKRDRVREQDPNSAPSAAISPSPLPEEETSDEKINLLPLVRHLNSTAAADLNFPGLHHDAKSEDLHQALDWYTAHPTGNKTRMNWCSTRLRELQMRVGLWQAEFEKVEDGFKIAITSPSGKSWTRLEKTDSLRDAKKAFRNFAEFWVNGKEPSSLQGLGHPIRDRHDAETAIANSSELTTYTGNQPALLREQPPIGSPATSRKEQLPAELPAVPWEEQLPTELPAVSREEQLPQEWDNAMEAAAAVSPTTSSLGSAENFALEGNETDDSAPALGVAPGESTPGNKEQLTQESDNAMEAAATKNPNNDSQLRPEAIASMSSATCGEESWKNFQLEVIEVPIASLRKYEKFQPRVGLNENAVERYQQMLETTEPPPIQIWHGTPPGEEEADYVIDGHHRLAASKRAGKKTIKAKRITNDWALAVYVANTANLDNGLQLNKWEIESACKNLIRVAKDLSSEATKEILTQLAKKTGKPYRGLNNTAIANLFGYSHRTIINYKQDIEKEEAIAAFQPGQWVLMNAPKDSTDTIAVYLRLLPEEYRLAKVIQVSIRGGVKLKPDHPRLANKIWQLEPEWLTIVTDKPKKHKPTNFKPGDDVQHWLSKKTGTVVSIEEPQQNPWTSLAAITETYPLVKWHHTGLEEAEREFELSLIGFSEPLTIEQRISGLKAAIASIEGEGWEHDRLYRKLNTQIKTLQARQADYDHPSGGSNPVESTSANNTEFHSVKKEEHAIAFSVGLREKNGQLLPDTDHSASSKHPENPRTTAVDTLELLANSPAEDSLFLEAKRARAFAALDTLKTCHDALTKKELIELISWCKAQMNDRI